MRIALVVGYLLTCTSPAGAQDRVLGLLTLPEVFGNGACDRFSPQEVALRTSPGGAPVGVIRVARNWYHAPIGGCEGLEVAVRLRNGAREQPLPAEEYEYEAPAAIVLERRSRWFRLRLETGSAWVLASSRDVFHPLEQLYEDALTYLTPEWNKQLADAPGGRGRTATMPIDRPEPSVRVLGSRRSGGRLWFQIEVMSHVFCEDHLNEPKAIDRGWVIAHGPSGQPAIWFSSRGC